MATSLRNFARFIGAKYISLLLQHLQAPELRQPRQHPNQPPSSAIRHKRSASGLGSGGANGGFNPLYQIGGPRSIQLALKLQFSAEQPLLAVDLRVASTHAHPAPCYPTRYKPLKIIIDK